MLDQYQKKGFEILCVTAENSSDGKQKTEEFIKSTELKAAVGYLSAGDNTKLMKSMGARGYPSAALINPKGKIVWKGHPSGLKKDVIEDHISGARTGSAGGGISFDVELPKKYASIAKGLSKGKVGAGLSKIDKALQSSSTAESAKPALNAAREEIEQTWNAEMGAVAQAKGDGRYFDALSKLDLLVKHFKGHAWGKKAADEMKAIKSNKELKHEIEAGKRIAKAQADLAADKKAKARKALEILTTGFLKDTREAARAKIMLADME